MALLIYKDGEGIAPQKKKQYETDDWGNEYLSVMGNQVIDHWRLKEAVEGFSERKEAITQWHVEWQRQLETLGMELERLEKDPDAYGSTLRRGDAVDPNAKVLVEVQHSSITQSDLSERTNFWVSLGYDVVWIFAYPRLDTRHRYSSFYSGLSEEKMLKYIDDEIQGQMSFESWTQGSERFERGTTCYWEYSREPVWLNLLTEFPENVTIFLENFNRKLLRYKQHRFLSGNKSYKHYVEYFHPITRCTFLQELKEQLDSKK